ncbi:MAG: M55 family metallopeptidase [Gemmatimonadetes bacterium]|nr:M55 family metallopeptidase [Gemmatimonadota bacterium]MDA1104015.1 M55 family metallopeptidase [Gemmatimonadota bacterium]
MIRRIALHSTLAALVIVGLALPGTDADAQEGLKVYISADMEGVVGVVSGDQLGPTGFEYARFRQIMTNEVNAAIEAAREMGATEILVSDSHGNGENLLIEQLPADIQLIRSWPRPLMMMEGIDASFDAAIFIGYHSSTSNTQGVRAHTISSANLTSVRINGVEMMEASINAAIAGDFGVPVVMISGDDATIDEAHRIIGDMEGAVVKWSLGFHSARTIMPEASYALIGDRVRTALRRLDDFQPYRMSGPVTLEISFKNYMPAEVMAYLPNVDRVDAHTIRFIGKDMTEVSKFIEFTTNYAVNITP